jgi:hypothetical protein
MRSFAPAGADESGQAIVELALALPILLILIVSVFEFGRAWNEQQVITDAAREGARYCTVANADKSLPDDIVVTKVTEALGRAGIPTPGGQPNVQGFRGGEACTVQITIPYQFAFLGPLLQWSTGQKNINLSSTFTMRNE